MSARPRTQSKSGAANAARKLRVGATLGAVGVAAVVLGVYLSAPTAPSSVGPTDAIGAQTKTTHQVAPRGNGAAAQTRPVSTVRKPRPRPPQLDRTGDADDKQTVRPPNRGATHPNSSKPAEPLKPPRALMY